MKQPLFVIIALQLLLVSCVKDKPNSPVQPQVQLSTAKKVYIINEGPFQSGNGSVSLYDPATGNVVDNYYKTQNQEEAGNVVQSLEYINGSFYLVVNNSGKILVCNDQFKRTGQITGLTSPRYILAVTNQKAYVSDLYADALSVVDLSTNTKLKQIALNGETERMALIYNKAFVTAPESNYLYAVNTISDTKSDSVDVGKGASCIVIDKNDKIWVLGSGDQQHAGRISRINALSNAVEWSASFAVGEFPGSLCLNKTKDTLYFLNNGICRMAIGESALPSSPLVPKGNRNFYGLGIDHNDHSIYASDAQDYISRSVIYIFSSSGNEQKHFTAGLIANGFYFE